MAKALIKNTFREIKNSKARFISIMAIIALGVGFFSGIKATAPSMYNLAETYYREQNLMDYRLVSTVGFDKDDIDAVSRVEGVTSVMPSYYCDVLKTAESGGDAVRLIALPTEYENFGTLNTLVVKEGRLPQKKGEIAVEDSAFLGTDYEIGEKVQFSKIAGETDVTSKIKNLEYTIVGFIESPLYISYQRGTTAIGNGKITGYMYILPDDFAFERYTELYVKAEMSDDYSAFSKDYDNAVKDMSKTLENTANARCEVFNADVADKAKTQLQDAKDELKSEREKADSEFADAKRELDDGKAEFDKQIADAVAALDEAKARIESGSADLAAATEEYYSQIEAADIAINTKSAELEEAEKNYNSSKAEFESEISRAQAELDGGRAQYEKAYAEFKNVQEPQLTAGIEQAQSTVDGLKEAIAAASEPEQLALLNQQLEQAQTALDGLNMQYGQAVSELEQSKAQLDGSQAQLDAKKAEGQAQLDEAKRQLDEGIAAVAEATAQLEAQRAEGGSRLAAAQAELDSAQAQYDSGASELDLQKAEGQKKLDDGQKEYDEKKAEAEEKFAEAQQKIDDAQIEVDGIAEPEWYVFTRKDNPGYSTFSQNADRLDAVASVFPVFFLLVAVLVCVTTMTRLIEEKRTEIGTLKALGYGNVSIIMKFVIYSLIAGVTGSIIGTVIGVSTLPFIIYNAYKIMYYIGDITLVINVPSVILGIAAAIVCTTVVSVVVCQRSLSHKPASIMCPKAPKPGKRIFLEHIAPLWKRMGFTAKLTARNLLRYKSRLCMTVIGVAGCTALIVAAFGLLNSFVPLTNDQFETIYKYDAVVVPKESGTDSQLKRLVDEVKEEGNAQDYMLTVQEEVTVKTGDAVKKDGTYLSVVQNPDKLGSIISLHTHKGKTELTLDDSGVLINEKLSEELGIEIGDVIALSSDSGECEVKISGIFEQYINNYIYMTPALYKSLYNKDVEYNMLNVKLSDTSDGAKDSFSQNLLGNSKIAAVSFLDTSLDDFKNMFDSLNLVAMVMIVCAAALAFVVLYNLTNINIAERVREIATFKVLGFYNRETSSFIYIENIVLTILGILVGLVMGIFLTSFIVQTVEVDNIMFGREIFPESFIYATGFTLLFSMIVNFVMNFKIKAVNMVESLKSVE